MNNRGFVVSAVLYPLLVLFLSLMMGLISMINIRKSILDKMKLDITDSIFEDEECVCKTIALNIKNYESRAEFPIYGNGRNDIGIVSRLEVNKYYLTDKRPSTKEEGNIWIYIKQASTTTITEGEISIPIAYIEQYENGEWKKKESAIYDGSKWVTLDYNGNNAKDETATEKDILSGKTAIVNGNKITGTMPTLPTAGKNESVGVSHANATGVAAGQLTSGDNTSYLYLGIPNNTYTGNNLWIRSPYSSVATALGITANKILKGQTIAGVSGTATSDANAAAGNILSGKTAYVNGSKITGTMPNQGGKQNAKNQYFWTDGSGKTYLVSWMPEGYYSGWQKSSDGTMNAETWTTQESIATAAGVTSNKIAKGQSVLGISGTYTSDANAVAGNILSGKTAYVNGSKITGTMQNWTNGNIWVNTDNGTFTSNNTYTYSSGYTTNEMVAFKSKNSGYFDSNTKFIFGQKTELAPVIAKGQSVLGISGTYTSDANAAAGNILSGKTAYVNGSKITGTMADRTNNTGTTGLAWAHNSSNSYEQIGDQLRIAVSPGYYGSNTYSNWGTSGIVFSGYQNKLGITANKILKGQSISGINGTATSDANAAAGNILSGQTAYVNGSKITGTMANQGAYTNAVSVGYLGGTIYTRIPQGAYLTNTTMGYPEIMTSASGLGITADKILSGKTIAGIEGTATSDADATASDIKSGKTAYVNGTKITGTANVSGISGHYKKFNASGNNNLSGSHTATESGTVFIFMAASSGSLYTNSSTYSHAKLNGKKVSDSKYCIASMQGTNDGWKVYAIPVEAGDRVDGWLQGPHDGDESYVMIFAY